MFCIILAFSIFKGRIILLLLPNPAGTTVDESRHPSHSFSRFDITRPLGPLHMSPISNWPTTRPRPSGLLATQPPAFFFLPPPFHTAASEDPGSARPARSGCEPSCDEAKPSRGEAKAQAPFARSRPGRSGRAVASAIVDSRLR